MKFWITYILFFFCSLTGLVGQQIDGDVRVTISFNNVPFQEVVESIEENYPIHFYYEKEWVKSIIVSIDAKDISVSDLMKRLLISTSLDYVLQIDGSIFIIPTGTFVKQLPNYYLPSIGSESAKDDSSDLNRVQEKYLLGRQPDMINTIVIGSYDKAKQGKVAVITGKLTDEETGAALVGATMYIPELQKGAVSDATGFVTMALKRGIYTAIFQYLGMAEVKGNIDVRSDGYFTLSLKRRSQVIGEILIQGEKSTKRRLRQGMETVSIKAMKELPSLMGEKDVMKVAQMLPGIVSVGEGSAGVNVRGGNADQNLFYINEIPVYNSSHLFGFFSSINSDIIENFSIYKGQVPAEYGGRLSSVFNIETRKGHKNKFFTQGGISPISANAEIETPIVKNKASLIFSARSSYSDWILKRLNDPDLRNSNASFYDFAGGMDVELDKKNQLALFAYNSSDKFNLNGYTEYGYGNLGGAVNYSHRFSPRVKASISLISSIYTFETIEKNAVSEAYSHSYELNHTEFRGYLSLLASDSHSLKIGTDAILYNLNRGVLRPYGEGSLKEVLDLGKEKGLEATVFFDDNISVGSRLNFYTGFRLNKYTEIGPKFVRDYYPGTSFDNSNVSSTREYRRGSKISSYINPEVRVGLTYKLWNSNSVKLSLNQMSQNVFMLSNSISIAPTDQWKLADSHIKPPKSIQYSAGYYQDFPRLGLNISTELYYKRAKNIVESRDGTDFLSSPFVETAVLQGAQDAYGVEFMLSKPTGRINGWASYTFSRSFVTVNGQEDWADINKGKKYPSNFDKPNVFNTILIYNLSRRFSLSTNLSYSSGRPVTMPKGIYYVGGQPFVDYSNRNEYRIPDYFRMDLSLKIDGNLKAEKLTHSYWTISVYNLTGRSNANSVFFLSEGGNIRGYKYSVIGLPIFTVSWSWKLGNYENN